MYKKQIIVVLAVFLISNLALSMLIISLSNRAQRQRATNNQLLIQQEENTRNSAIAVRAFECILLVEPQARNQDVVDQCKTDAAASYTKE